MEYVHWQTVGLMKRCENEIKVSDLMIESSCRASACQQTFQILNSISHSPNPVHYSLTFRYFSSLCRHPVPFNLFARRSRCYKLPCSPVQKRSQIRYSRNLLNNINDPIGSDLIKFPPDSSSFKCEPFSTPPAATCKFSSIFNGSGG
jgi:hypothetical protein